MPAIWNVGNFNKVNSNKLSSKLTFKVGESFKGQIVDKGDGKNVVIKLTDGWQFEAEVLDNNFVEAEGLLQFKVEGFNEGKLKLNIIQVKDNSEEATIDDAIEGFVTKEGISKEDKELLSSMLKFNIQLTKENISFVKSIVNFNEKIKNNPKEVQEFIDNFLSGKGIDSESAEGKNIKDVLNTFFSNFESMSTDEILLFMENGIDLNSENIESYNKLFKQDSTLKEYFDQVEKDLESLNLPKVDVNEVEINNKSIEEKTNIRYGAYPQNQNIVSKIYDENSTTKAKISIVSLLNSINNMEENIMKESVKDIITTNKNKFTNNELKFIFSKLDSLSEEEVVILFKGNEAANGDTKEGISKIFSNLLGREINVTQNDFEKLKNIIEYKIDKDPNLQASIKEKTIDTGINENNIIDSLINKEEILKNSESIKGEILKQGISPDTKEIKAGLEKKMDGIKDLIKELIAHSKSTFKGEGIEKAMDFIKSNINDFKLFNSLSNEYYYLDMPINRNGEEYPCKLIIKDDRKENKQIDKKNVKLVVAVNTVHLGKVDGYLDVHDNNLTVKIKCDKRYVGPLNKGKGLLMEKLQNIGYLVNLSVEEKIEEVSLTSCRKFFDDNNKNAINITV